MSAPIETKVTAGSLTGLLTGLIVWGLVSYVPAFHHGVPMPVQEAIPWVLTLAGSAIAAYLAPHTHRPDLGEQGAKPTASVLTPPSGGRLPG
jgi:hypothetical protein